MNARTSFVAVEEPPPLAEPVGIGAQGHRVAGDGRIDAAPMPTVGVVFGTLLALTDDGGVAVVASDAEPARALKALSLVDLHGIHVGRRVAMSFEADGAQRPVVIGLLRGPSAEDQASLPLPVELEADGERMVVSARERLVLRCGKASITLTKAGKVLIEGSYLLSRSTGVNRIKGGSVQLN